MKVKLKKMFSEGVLDKDKVFGILVDLVTEDQLNKVPELSLLIGDTQSEGKVDAPVMNLGAKIKERELMSLEDKIGKIKELIMKNPDTSATKPTPQPSLGSKIKRILRNSITLVDDDSVPKYCRDSTWIVSVFDGDGLSEYYVWTSVDHGMDHLNKELRHLMKSAGYQNLYHYKCERGEWHPAIKDTSFSD